MRAIFILKLTDLYMFDCLPSLSKHMPNNFSKANCAALVFAIFLLRPIPIKR